MVNPAGVSPDGIRVSQAGQAVSRILYPDWLPAQGLHHLSGVAVARHL